MIFVRGYPRPLGDVVGRVVCRAALAALVVACLAGQASAQLLRGRLVDELTGTPVEAAVVQLVDSAGERRAAVLSGTGGSYVVRLPGAGAWTLRVQRLGYRTADFGPYRVEPGGTRVEELRLPAAPVELEGVVAEGSRRCVVDPASGSDAATLWAEAKKVLEVAALVTREELYLFDIVRFRRRTTVDRTVLLDARGELDVTARPFESPPADSLVEHGFVQRQGEDIAFYMPDPEVVLTRAFVETHCFRVSEDPADPGRVGLAFEPLEGRRPSDVRGVLWLDRETGALRSLEYGYHAPLDAIREHAGGWARFDQLENGAWVIRRWMIRMPTLVEERRRRVEVVDLVEEGGELLEVATPSGRLLTRPPRGRVTGVVVDSLRGGAPLEGAVVYAAGAPWADTTDVRGGFVLDGLPSGEHALTWRHPRLDTLAISLPLHTVRVPRTSPIRMALPSRAGLLPRICGDMEPDGPLGVIATEVRGPDGAPAGGVTVEMAFVERGRERTRSFRTGDNGFVRFCSVPPGPVSVSVGGSGARAVSVLPPGGFVRLDLELSASRPDSGREG